MLVVDAIEVIRGPVMVEEDGEVPYQHLEVHDGLEAQKKIAGEPGGAPISILSQCWRLMCRSCDWQDLGRTASTDLISFRELDAGNRSCGGWIQLYLVFETLDGLSRCCKP